MRIAVLGAGALGSVIGGLAAQAGIDIRLLDVNQAHLDAINDGGLQLDTPAGSSRVPIPAMRPDACPPDIDLVILLTKVFHTEAALRSIAPVIGAGAFVLSIQNGLGNAERVAAFVPKDRVLYGTTMITGDFLGPGHVATHETEPTTFKSATPAGEERARDVAAALAPVLFEYSAEADVKLWQKAAFNCAMNATCGLTGGTVGVISASPEGAALVKEMAAEVVAVANAKGIAVQQSAVDAQIDFALAEHRSHKASMLQDLEAGRPTEIEALCGEVERQADALGIPAPLNRTLAALMRMKQAVVTSPPG